MAEGLTALTGAVKGLGTVGTPAAIALAGHPVLAVIIEGAALVAYLLAPAAGQVRQWLGDVVGRKLGTLSSPTPGPAVQPTSSAPQPLSPVTTPQPVP